MTMNRRDMMLQMGLAATSSLWSQFLPQISWAQTADHENDFFLTIYLPFGWDTSLCLDPWTSDQKPKESDYFIEYRQDQLLPLHNGFVGPAMSAVQKHFQRMSIVNGVFISGRDNGHDSAAHYMLSGNGQNSLGVMSLELEGKKFHSPFGTVANVSAKSAGKAKVIMDINTIIVNKSIGEADSLFVIDEQNSELTKSKQAILQYSEQMSLFNRLMTDLTKNQQTKEHHAVAAAFLSGLSSTAYLRKGGIILDTHSNHEGDHLGKLQTFFTDLNETLDFFSSIEMPNATGVSMLDRITIMLTSDFTRTPALNTSKGKDHNPQTNSVMLISPHLKPGIFGQSQLITREISPMKIPYLASMPLDLETMQPKASKDGTFILRPESVFSTLLTAMKFDPALISPSFVKAPVLRTMLK